MVEWGIVYGIGELTTKEKTVIETALRLKLRNLARNDFLQKQGNQWIPWMKTAQNIVAGIPCFTDLHSNSLNVPPTHHP